jgi:hypothetical protein
MRGFGIPASDGVIYKLAHHQSQHATDSLRQPAGALRIQNAFDPKPLETNHLKMPAESKQIEFGIDFSRLSCKLLYSARGAVS